MNSKCKEIRIDSLKFLHLSVFNEKIIKNKEAKTVPTSPPPHLPTSPIPCHLSPVTCHLLPVLLLALSTIGINSYFQSPMPKFGIPKPVN